MSKTKYEVGDVIVYTRDTYTGFMIQTDEGRSIDYDSGCVNKCILRSSGVAVALAHDKKQWRKMKSLYIGNLAQFEDVIAAGVEQLMDIHSDEVDT